MSCKCVVYLVRSRRVRLGVAHHDEGEHGAAVEDPRREREKLDQRVDRPVQHHRHRYQRLAIFIHM